MTPKERIGSVALGTAKGIAGLIGGTTWNFLGAGSLLNLGHSGLVESGWTTQGSLVDVLKTDHTPLFTVLNSHLAHDFLTTPALLQVGIYAALTAIQFGIGWNVYKLFVVGGAKNIVEGFRGSA